MRPPVARKASPLCLQQQQGKQAKLAGRLQHRLTPPESSAFIVGKSPPIDARVRVSHNQPKCRWCISKCGAGWLVHAKQKHTRTQIPGPRCSLF